MANIKQLKAAYQLAKMQYDSFQTLETESAMELALEQYEAAVNAGDETAEPAAPAAPAKPSTPASKPATSTKPAPVGKPATPAKAVTPAKPVAPAVPVAPVAPVASTQPAENLATDQDDQTSLEGNQGDADGNVSNDETQNETSQSDPSAEQEKKSE